ncbi:hypothetical protein D3C77_421210 [compost metagenome]
MIFIRIVISHPDRTCPFRGIADKPYVPVLAALQILDAVLRRSRLTGNRTVDSCLFPRAFIHDILQHLRHLISSLLLQHLLLLRRIRFMNLFTAVVNDRLDRIRLIVSAFVCEHTESRCHFQRIRSMR